MTNMSLKISLLLSVLLSVLLDQAQQTVATNTNVIVPPLVNYSGVLADVNGKPLTEITGVTFYLYRDQQGGAPLWMETQNVEPDSHGHYRVMLGSTTSQGLPSEIFASGQAHWLGVQVRGQEELPRVLLVAAPYALKAVDAETIGGLPPSAFVLAAPPTNNAASATNSSPATSASVTPATSSDVTTSGGTLNTVALFTTATNIQSSPITVVGATKTVNVGGTLGLPAIGQAKTTTVGYDSQPLVFTASAYNVSSKAAEAQTFQWQAQPVGNGTSAPSGSLNLLFASGTSTPAQTGLQIAGNGLITFAKGQTFPGTGKGSVTSIASGAGLTGGPITSSGTLSIAGGGVSNAMLENSSITLSPGTALTGGGTVSLGGGITLDVDTTKVPLLNVANKFSGNQSITGNVSATGSVSGQTASFSGNNTTEIVSVTQSGNGRGVLVNSQSGVAVGGVNNSPSGILTAGVAGSAIGTGGAGVIGGASSTTGSTFGVYGQSSSTSGTGVEGVALATSGSTVGVFGQASSSNGIGVHGVNSAGGEAGQFDGPVLVNGNHTVNGNLSATGVVSSNAYQIGSNLFDYGSYTNANAFLGFAGNTSTTGTANTGAGYQALSKNTTGSDNAAFGYLALYENTQGSQNTAVGYYALFSNIGDGETGDGLYNTAVGSEALIDNTSGFQNTAVGGGALYSNSIGNDLTCIGYQCTASDGITNATAIGAHAVVEQSNSLVLGGTGHHAIKVGIGTTRPSNILTVGRGAGHPVSDSWETYSSRRWKTNIHPLQNALAKVEQLRGVSYDVKANGKHEVGVIAEEVGAVVPEVVTWDKNGKDAQSVDYSRLTALLIEATKEQQREIQSQAAVIRELKSELRATRQTLEKVKEQVDATQPSLVATK